MKTSLGKIYLIIVKTFSINRVLKTFSNVFSLKKKNHPRRFQYIVCYLLITFLRRKVRIPLTLFFFSSERNKSQVKLLINTSYLLWAISTGTMVLSSLTSVVLLMEP